MDLITVGDNLPFLLGLGMLFYQWLHKVRVPKREVTVKKFDLTGLRPEVTRVIVEEIAETLTRRGKTSFKVINLERVRDENGAIITTLAWDAITNKFLHQASTKDDIADYLNKKYPDHLFIVNDDDFKPTN